MKALVVYSKAAGKRDFSCHVPLLEKELAGTFETLDFRHTSSEEEASLVYEDACAKYEVVIVCGGDGTFNNAVNAIMPQPRKPILGYVNFGTIGDVGKNFGVTRSLSEALAIIRSQHVEKIDIGEIISKGKTRYFAYCAAFGVFSDIAYGVTRSEKKKVGRLAYYNKAVGEVFEKNQHPYSYESERLKKTSSAPFIMVLNGRNIGGFIVNRKGKINDGKMEIFLTKKGLFNGLLHYLPFSTAPDDVCSNCRFSGLEDLPWCLDGEKGPKGDVSFILEPSKIDVFSQKL
jgi:diacylglycerol kinase (ATP)